MDVDDGLERGRDCLQRWGFRRCEDIVWAQTESCTQYAPASPSLLTPVVQHCLMGIRGTVVRSTDSFEPSTEGIPLCCNSFRMPARSLVKWHSTAMSCGCTGRPSRVAPDASNRWMSSATSG